MKAISVKLCDDLLAKLERYAIKHNMNRSEAIREAIKRLLEKENLNITEE